MKIVFFLISGLLCLLAIAMTVFAKEQAGDSQRFLGTWKLVASVHTDGTPNLVFG
jgi:hypothetical protein